MDAVALGYGIRDAIDIFIALAVPVIEPPGPPQFGWIAGSAPGAASLAGCGPVSGIAGNQTPSVA